MEKRYQVFVSSTFEDLQEERRVVISALISMNCFPSAMEFFLASDEDQWSLIKRVIDDCDYYVVIVGGRYGSIDEKTGLSFTEKEYDYAVSLDKPVLGFVHGQPAIIPQGKAEQSEAATKSLESFRAKVQRKMCKRWTTPAELGLAVALSMPQLMKLRPSAGWISGNDAIDPARENALRARIEELEGKLSTAVGRPPEGTEHLASGDDACPVSIVVYDFNNRRDVEHMTVTWNELFGCLGSFLLDELDQTVMSEHLAKWLLFKRFSAGFDYHSAEVPDADLRKIKLQFYALGLIQRLPNSNWTLTPHGENYLRRSAAVRKPSAS